MIPYGDNVLAAPLYTLGLTTRVTNILVNSGLDTIGDLVAMSEFEILELHYLGPGALTQIKTKLGELGLELRAFPPAT